MPTYHVTTFGCQMNEHDSERMKGMLESLGYEEIGGPRGRRSDPVQHLLHPREGRRALRRPPRRGRAVKRERPRARGGGGRLLGAVGQGGGVPPLPVRRRGLRPRPGAPAGRVPDLRLADRAGLLRVRGLHRPPAGEARAGVPGVAADLGGLPNCAARTASSPPPAGRRCRGRPTSWWPRSSAWPARACARSPCWARTSTPTGATCARSGSRSPSCCARSTAWRASSASATRAPTRRTCART